MITEGFYSVIRYTSNPGRGESKNVALLLVDEDRDKARMRIAPLSQVVPRLTEHGLLDGLLVRLAARLQEGEFRDPRQIVSLQSISGPTLTLTSPMPTAITDDFDGSLKALYRALVAPRQGRDAGVSHGKLLDRLVKACRTAGVTVSPGTYVDDILFDAVVVGPERRIPIQVLSFETESDSPRGLEQAAGHFLYGLGRIHEQGVCVIQPPFVRTNDAVRASYRKVTGWMAEGGVNTVGSDELPLLASSVGGADPLPLVMST